MTKDEFWTRAGTVEHEQLDFKRSADYLKEIIPAMAMTAGGTVVLGVDDDRALRGLALNQKVFDSIMRVANTVGVAVDTFEVEVDGHKLTVVEVPAVAGQIVTTTDGRLLHRVGSDCVPLVGDALARFVRDRHLRPAEDEPLSGFEAADFDLQAVNQALRAAGRPACRRTSLRRGLLDLRLAVQDDQGQPAPLRAAAVLFALDPSRYARGASIQVVRREGVNPGPGPASLRQRLEGPISRLVEEVVVLIGEQTERYEVVMGTHRETLPEYPSAVLREALLNALGHRDYGLEGSTVDVTIFDDRLEIQSPGPLPGHITLANIRDEHYSRNGRIMSTLKLLDLVEEYGEGVDRMISEMEARLMQPPRFDASSSSVTVTLYNRFLVSVEEQAWLALIGHYDVAPQERRVLLLARRHGALTPRLLRDQMPGEDPKVLLQGATAKGLLIRIGSAGGSRYVLSDEVVLRAGSSGLEARSRQRQRLLDEVRRRGSISTSGGVDLIGEEAHVVRQLLNDLARNGLIEARGQTRARRYFPR